MARLAIFSARPRLFYFLDCKTKIEKPQNSFANNQDCGTFGITQKTRLETHQIWIKYCKTLIFFKDDSPPLFMGKSTHTRCPLVRVVHLDEVNPEPASQHDLLPIHRKLGQRNENNTGMMWTHFIATIPHTRDSTSLSNTLKKVSIW